MRLGFSVAIFTDPDILITDEVLAVGDEAFQRKCMDRIWRFRREGRTIIFVSHNLASVRSLCNRAIWLQHGEFVADGPAGDVIDQYIARAYQTADRTAAPAAGPRVGGNRWGSGEAVITDVSFLDRDRKRREVFETGELMTVRVEFIAHERIANPQFGVAIHRSDGLHITGPNSVVHGAEVPSILGRGAFEYTIPSLPLLQGTYEFTAAIYDHDAVRPYDHHHRMYTFHVWNSQPREREGHLAIPARWLIESESEGVVVSR
ncbi:MAG: Wzt carbohydrate-binding domain-containing protein, partial [Dehalococcoidia bacterium]|nr:Wzt carbohydrate-binding domain-containing protein [Dehalococcoidia bacterium]